MALTLVDYSVINNNIKRYKVEDLNYGRIVCGIPKIFSSCELLEYFINQYKTKLNGSTKVNDMVIIRYVACILAILMRIDSSKEKANADILSKVDSLTNDYEDYINRTNSEKNEELCVYLDKVSSFYLGKFAFNLDRYKEKQEELNTDLVDQNLSEVVEEENKQVNVQEVTEAIKENATKIKELEKEVTKLKKLVDKKQRLLEAEQENTTKLRETNKKSVDEINELRKQLANSLKEKNSLNETINSLEEKVESYKTINASLEEKIKLSLYKEQMAVTANMSKEKRKKLEKLQEQIISIIVDKSLTLDGVALELENKNIQVELEEINQVLTLLDQKYNVVFDKNTGVYRIKQIKCQTDMNFELPLSGNCLQFLLMADEHIDSKDAETYDNFDAIYDYCAGRELNTILHIGDLLNFNKGYNKLSEKLEHYRKDIDIVLNKYPKDPNIKNYYLGGNHEKRVHMCGLDPVSYIAKERSDFVSLGYTHAILNVLNSQIAFHHPDKRLRTDIRNIVPDYIHDYQEKINVNPEDIYLNILGHYHRCYLNQESCYFLAPSYNFTTKSLNAVCHLKIYLDSEGKIESISIITLPLVGASKRLMSAGEMEYKKVLK